MHPWLIIPVKPLADGKSRLAPVLARAERRRLNERLLRRALRIALAFPGARRTLVVSRCRHALALARSYGVQGLRERRPHGLNAAASQALARARACGAGAVMLAACDLPRLRASDLRALARAGRALRRGLVLCSDESGSGTNALYLAAHASLPFRFGRDSLQRHLRAARLQRLAVKLYPNERIARDLDTPQQLRRWRRELARRAPRGAGRSGCR